MKYLDKKTGRVLFVADGISAGTSWGTFYRKPSGALCRIKSPRLPMRDGPRGRFEAQRDLNLYAGLHGLQQVKEHA